MFTFLSHFAFALAQVTQAIRTTIAFQMVNWKQCRVPGFAILTAAQIEGRLENAERRTPPAWKARTSREFFFSGEFQQAEGTPILLKGTSSCKSAKRCIRDEALRRSAVYASESTVLMQLTVKDVDACTWFLGFTRNRIPPSILQLNLGHSVCKNS